MPTYTYKCSNCDSITTLIRKIAYRNFTETDTCEQCSKVGTLTRLVDTPIIGYSTYINGGGKPPDGFKDVLKKIHANTPGSQIDKTSSYW